MHLTVHTDGRTGHLRLRLALLFTLAIVECMGSPLHAEVYVYHTQLTTFSPRDLNEHNRTGWGPVGELVQTADGLFYGVTFAGGANGSGVVFAYDRTDVSTPIHDLHDFGALQGGTASQPPTNADGAAPLAGLVLGADGYLYGTTSAGGAAGFGTIFRVSTSGSLTTLHEFSARDADGRNADGAIPRGKLAQAADGSFIGTTRFGGNTAGTVFRITPAGAFSVLYTFPAKDANETNDTGAAPVAGVTIANDGNYYGVAQTGGANKGGSVFKLTPAGVFSVLHTFSSSESGSNTDGGSPSTQLMQARDGKLYGTTSSAGPAGSGTLFRISTSGAFEALHGFNEGPILINTVDSIDPAGPLLEAPDGTLYGTSGAGGGSSAYGTVYKLSPTGAFSVAYSFAMGGSLGAAPAGGLIIGNDGHLYGLTRAQALDNFEFSGTGVVYLLRTSTTQYMNLTVTPPTITVDDTFTTSWTAPAGGGCFTRDGVFDTQGSVTRGSGIFGDLPVSLGCSTPLGEATMTVIEHILPAVPAVSMSASPTSITLGTSTALTFTTHGTSECMESGAWSGDPGGAYGTLQVTPLTTGVKTYTMTCTGPGGTASASVDVTVGPAVPPSVTVSVSPATITVGDQSPTLAWSSSGAQSCSASGSWSGTRLPNDSLTLNNLQPGSYTYSLTCTGPGGSGSSSASLRVNAASNGGGSGGGGAMSLLNILVFGAFVLLAQSGSYRRSKRFSVACRLRTR